jgi:hypothetical protein
MFTQNEMTNMIQKIMANYNCRTMMMIIQLPTKKWKLLQFIVSLTRFSSKNTQNERRKKTTMLVWTSQFGPTNVTK